MGHLWLPLVCPVLSVASISMRVLSPAGHWPLGERGAATRQVVAALTIADQRTLMTHDRNRDERGCRPAAVGT